MSLDVYLKSPVETEKECCQCGNTYKVREEIYWANITHNLADMAQAAGIYYALWQPEEINATRASDIIELLENGLADLNERPEYFKQFNSPNGWGTYKRFVPFVEEYLNACKEYPDAIIYVSR